VVLHRPVEPAGILVNWAGVTPLLGRCSKEWNTDLVFGEPGSGSRHKASFVSGG
jgi:hypothetical protein